MINDEKVDIKILTGIKIYVTIENIFKSISKNEDLSDIG